VAPDDVTFEYLKGRKFSPVDSQYEKAKKHWKTLLTDQDAVFDKEYTFSGEDIEPMVTFGTNPGMGIKISDKIPSLESIDASSRSSYQQALDYMDVKPGKPLKGHRIDWVFLGSCTNGRIEDLRDFANLIKGKKKAPHVKDLIVPGSKQVEKQAIAEGLDKILTEAGFTFRQPGCSACLAMNEDKIPEKQYCISTSNRNFEGRQGQGARTILASPLTAAASAITGYITDPREYI
jgi:3-isopropylmalate/(R)-2-methylmalate dehydratase large subunit